MIYLLHDNTFAYSIWNMKDWATLLAEQIAFAIVRGGWPASIGDTEKNALRHAIDYVEVGINADVSRVDNIEKNPALRSKTAIRTSPKRQFVDPSIAAAVMRFTTEHLPDDFKYFGFLFESLCDRDLRIYAEAIDGQVFHYRDSSGLEADAVIALNDGRWAAIAAKLGSKEIEEVAYRRNDGVFVVPIGCLKN